MINNKHKDSGCGFSEQLIAFLYDESSGAEKALFEKHLTGCPICADELEVFSGVHFSINDWKLNEFASIQTPTIEIPYERIESSVKKSEVKGSWLAGLRDLFSLSPRVWSLTTASLAVLAVFGGIVYFAFNSPKNDEVVESNKTRKSVILPTVEKTIQPSNSNNNTNNSSKTPSKPVAEPKPEQPELAVSDGTDLPNNRVVKVSDAQRQKPKTDSNNKQNADKTVKKPENKKEVPVVSPYDDEEDDTLRLAEMFEEIDTK